MEHVGDYWQVIRLLLRRTSVVGLAGKDLRVEEVLKEAVVAETGAVIAGDMRLHVGEDVSQDAEASFRAYFLP